MPALMPRNPHRNAPEYADRVNLIKKIKINKDWRFAPVVPEANGRLKDKVRVNGEVEVHSEGSFFFEGWGGGGPPPPGGPGGKRSRGAPPPQVGRASCHPCRIDCLTGALPR